jgi:uncharacterized protein YjbJ (UPF0337 family)
VNDLARPGAILTPAPAVPSGARLTSVTDSRISPSAGPASSDAATVSDASSSAKDAATKAADSAKEAAGKAADSAKDMAATAANAATSSADKGAAAAQDAAAKATDAVKGATGSAKAAPGPRSLDEIESDLDATRARLAGRIDDLQSYVSPTSIASRQVAKVKHVFVDEYGGIRPERVLGAVAVVGAILALGIVRRRHRG